MGLEIRDDEGGYILGTWDYTNDEMNPKRFLGFIYHIGFHSMRV